MKRVLAISSALLIVVSVLQAESPKRVATPAPAPDFWYVVPGEMPDAGVRSAVRGIVVPTAVRPTVQTTPAGSVISWRRPDGTSQSFVVQGVSSFTFAPGPIAGTMYVPFQRSKLLEYDPRSCCECASWQNMVESVELLGCVPGCLGCGCEGCICSPTYPCPGGPDDAMTLVAHNDPATAMRFTKAGAKDGLAIIDHGNTTVRFQGRRLSAQVTSADDTVIDGPDSITLSGRVESRASVRGDQSLFAWSSPYASVILEQPRSLPAPSFRDGTIDLGVRAAGVPTKGIKNLATEAVMDRCSACGTHPNSQADLDIYDCVPGVSVCYRCVSWECFAQ